MDRGIMKKYKDFELEVLGEKWSVIYSPFVADPQTGQASCGLCDFASKSIFISNSLDHQTTVITLIHELFHAYTRRSGIYNGMLSFDMEEIISDQFATVVAENFDFKL